jgi:hypothetical protein
MKTKTTSTEPDIPTRRAERVDMTRSTAISQILSIPRRGLCRIEAAAYIGVSPSLFDEMVMDARMPQPKVINTRTVWDRHQLDLAFEALPNREVETTPLVPDNGNEWDNMN